MTPGLRLPAAAARLQRRHPAVLRLGTRTRSKGRLVLVIGERRVALNHDHPSPPDRAHLA